MDFNLDMLYNIKKMQFIFIALALSALIYTLTTYIIKRKMRSCPGPIVKWRPLVRTFIEEQEGPPSVFANFQSLFWKTSPWQAKEVHSTQLQQNTIQPFAYGELPDNKIKGKRESDDFLGQFFG